MLGLRVRASMDLKINKTARVKGKYVYDWQLSTQFNKLDGLVEDAYEVHLIIGHALPVSLNNFQIAKYVAKSNLKHKELFDEVITYYDFLYSIETSLQSGQYEAEEIITYLQSDVQKIIATNRIQSAKPNSKILKAIIEQNGFLEKSNPTDHLVTKGRQLYDLVRQEGTKSGQRVILDRNLRAIEKTIGYNFR